MHRLMRPVVTGHAARQGLDMSVDALKEWLGEVTCQPHPTLEIEFVDTVEEFWAAMLPEIAPPAPKPTRPRPRAKLGPLVAMYTCRSLPLVLFVPGLLFQF